MLTIENIKRLEGMCLPNSYMVEQITISDNLYIFQLGRTIKLYNPMTFEALDRTHNKVFTLNRYLDELNPFYMLSDESAHYTWVNNDSLKDLNAFINKLNELTNLWS